MGKTSSVHSTDVFNWSPSTSCRGHTNNQIKKRRESPFKFSMIGKKKTFIQLITKTNTQHYSDCN